MADVESDQPLDAAAEVPIQDRQSMTTAVVVTAEDGKKKIIKKIVKKKRRPARPQVDPALFKDEPPAQTGTIFNIWYNKWSGGERTDAYASQTAARGRCNVALDSGFTRADRAVVGAYFCLFFARGVCPKGQDCDYYHRLPNSRLEKERGIADIFPSNVDCFGRDKFSDYRDDMGGVGSFMRINRTLYVGRVHVTDDIEEVVARHFQEWGQVERVRVLPARGVAFVTYVHLANAEFAKEAMAHQSLDNKEVLNVRWATMDPNPLAQKREVRKIEEQAAEAIRRTLPADYVAQLEGRGAGCEEATKRRKIEGTFGLEGYSASDKVWYAAEQARIDATPLQLSLEAADQDQEPLTIEDIQKSQQGRQNGILSGSTLKALKGFTAGNVAAKPAANKTPPALVGYGSDEDED